MRSFQDIRYGVANSIETYPETFSPLGWNLIGATRSLSDLVHRNVPSPARPLKLTMTRSDWVRS